MEKQIIVSFFWQLFLSNMGKKLPENYHPPKISPSIYEQWKQVLEFNIKPCCHIIMKQATYFMIKKIRELKNMSFG